MMTVPMNLNESHHFDQEFQRNETTVLHQKESGIYNTCNSQNEIESTLISHDDLQDSVAVLFDHDNATHRWKPGIQIQSNRNINSFSSSDYPSIWQTTSDSAAQEMPSNFALEREWQSCSTASAQQKDTGCSVSRARDPSWPSANASSEHAYTSDLISMNGHFLDHPSEFAKNDHSPSGPVQELPEAGIMPCESDALCAPAFQIGDHPLSGFNLPNERHQQKPLQVCFVQKNDRDQISFRCSPSRVTKGRHGPLNKEKRLQAAKIRHQGSICLQCRIKKIKVRCPCSKPRIKLTKRSVMDPHRAVDVCNKPKES